MSGSTSRVTRHRFTILSAAVALVGGGVVAANLAGAASGPSALDYAQCQNGAPGTTPSTDCAWINGILNASSSQYHEDQVTAQRLTVSFPDKGSSPHLHSVTLKYLDRKGSIHAYDYLAAADATIADARDLRCLGIEAICPTGSGVSHVTTDDPNSVPSSSGSFGGVSYSNVVSTHQGNLTTDDRSLWLYGATFATGGDSTSGYPGNTDPPAMTTPTHDCLSPCTGDDYATTTISFVTPAGTANHVVQLLFGGHLAAESGKDGWGTGLGAGSVSGGPYHIKWAAADGASVGNRDNQIMSGAIIITAAGGTIQTTPNVTEATVGDSSLADLTDSATYTPDSGSAPTGSITFKFYGPLTGTGYTDCTDDDPNTSAVEGNLIYSETGATLSPNGTGGYDATSASSAVDLSSADPGVYGWVASYAHGTDKFNTDVAGVCGDELVTIDQDTAVGTSSQTITDTVNVTGSGTPDGNVDWYLWTTSDCQDDGVGDPDLVFSDVVGDGGDDTNNALDGSGNATSDAFTPDPAAGGTTYYWQVDYEGDTLNAAGTVEACGDQQVTVQNAPAP